MIEHGLVVEMTTDELHRLIVSAMLVFFLFAAFLMACYRVAFYVIELMGRRMWDRLSKREATTDETRRAE